MDITIHPGAPLTLCRDTLGFGVRVDVRGGGMRRITVGPAGQSGASIALGPPAADPGDRRAVRE